MKLATTTADFLGYTHSQEQSLRLIHEAGFSFADYNFHADHQSGTGVYVSDYTTYFEQIKRATEEIGIRLIQAHAPMGDPIDEGNEQFITDTIRCVDACGAWGIPNLVVHSGYTRGLNKQQTIEKNKKFYEPILAHAEKYGINILVENFNKICVDGYYWIDNATDLLELIEYVDHPLFHAVWDAGHANLQEMSQDEELKILGNHVRALHIQDNMGQDDSHLLPFLGSMNMDAVMNGLKAIDYQGYFTFEVGSIFTPPQKKRQYPSDTRLLKAPLELKCAAEKLLFETGKYILQAYGCFEE